MRAQRGVRTGSANYEDKKITLVEWPKIIKEGWALKDLIGDSSDLFDEYLDLDDTERIEVNNYFKDRFDVDDYALEEIIEKAWDVAFMVDDLVRKIIAYRK